MESDRDKVKAFLKLIAVERGISKSEQTQLKRSMVGEDTFFAALPSNEVSNVHMYIKSLPPESPFPWIGYIAVGSVIVCAEEYSKYPTARQVKKLKTKYDELCRCGR